MTLSPYLRLIRLHQPTGIWLLLWPCWCAIALASEGLPSPALLGFFALGAVLMRGAGCIINDIADRELDRQVERTRCRPLASGELRLPHALAMLALLLAASFAIAVHLGDIVLLWSAIALIPVAMYPFMKRITWWPQLFLGLTFNWGVFMGWAAVRGSIEPAALALYLGTVFWTLGYDTIYAHQDKLDDVRAGVKSSALRLADHTKPVVGVFYAAAIVCWLLAGYHSRSHPGYFLMLLPVALHLGTQIVRVRLDDPASCRAVFISNARLGAWLFAACILSSV